MFSREISLIGKDKLRKLNRTHLVIVGVGGVGGFTAELLCRAGFANITLIDGDRVEKSNINRQIVASFDTIGHYKVDVLKDRLRSINPHVKVTVINKFIDKNNIKLIKKNSYVIDCIDDIENKVVLIEYCKKNDINIISALGAGNRISIPEFEVLDIFDTYNDRLARVLRKKLKDVNIDSLTCVMSKDKPIKKEGEVGSISYYPNAMSCVLASYVVNDIIKENNGRISKGNIHKKQQSKG